MKGGIFSLLLFFFINSSVLSQDTLNAPRNFHVTNLCGNLHLAWQSPLPGSDSLIGYQLFIDDTLFYQTTLTFYDTLILGRGPTLFGVKAIYISGFSGMESDEINLLDFTHATNLYETVCHYFWSPPEGWSLDNGPCDESWDNGFLYTSVGTNSQVEFDVAARWTTGQ